MEKTITKPSFEEVIPVTTMRLPDEGLIFNAQKVGPKNFNGLRQADYGKGFRMPTMPELVPLIYASLENHEYNETAKNVIKILRDCWITGNTAVHYFPQGMFAEDIPKMENGRIVTPTFKVLEKRLGSNEERGVVFSDDGYVRFTPYGFEREAQTALELSTNTGIIALVSGEENAEKLAKASEHHKLKPYFWALEDVDSPQTKVAALDSGSFDHRLYVSASYSGDGGGRFSFGVLE